MNAKKTLVAAVAAVALLVVAGVAYANGSGGEGDGSYEGSIAAPEQGGPSLRDLAKIDQATAGKTALEAVPGSVKEADLEVENGSVVYGVEVAGNDGKTHDVKVDAGNGKILSQQVDGADEPGDAEEAD